MAKYIRKNPPVFFGGVEYRTMRDACIAARISYQSYLSYCNIHPEIRAIRARSFEESIAAWRRGTEGRSHPRTCIEFEGAVYTSIRAACRGLGISYGKIDYAMRGLGWSFPGAVARVRKMEASRPRDHTGRRFSTLAEMCAAWGVTYEQYRERIRAGWSMARALSTDKPRGVTVDHTGRRFNTERELCDFWGVNRHTFRSRIKRYGWPLELALTKPVGMAR